MATSGVLDAWAVVAYLRGEPGAARLRPLLTGAGLRVCSVNLGEAFYALIRSHGEAAAGDRIAAVRRRVTVEVPDWPLTEIAARLKAAGGMSFADCYCVATAERHSARLYTGDPEIVARAGEVEVIDLRSP